MRVCISIISVLVCMTRLSHSQYRIENIPYKLDEVNYSDSFGKQGIWVFSSVPGGIVSAIQRYQNDTLHGYFERYWRTTGTVSEKGYYKMGKLDSVFVAYWENGVVRGITYYKDGILNGPYESFNSSGKLTSRYRFVNGVEDETYELAYLDSTVKWDWDKMVKVDTIRTKYSGDWNARWAIYHNDTLVKEMSFFKGNVAIENLLRNGLLEKRIVYSKKHPERIEKIFYYQNEELIRTEQFNKLGRLVE